MSWEFKEYSDWVECGCPINTTTRVLYITGRLTSLTTNIGNLQNLSSLYIISNKLTSFPSEIGNLRNLVNLYIVNNSNLVSLPAEIGNLLNLMHLYIVNNSNIVSLPAEIGNLRNLITFTVVENQMYIPPNIQRMLEAHLQPQGIYSDSQSVHNSTIQQSIKESILRLISIPPALTSEKVLASILVDSVLTEFTKQSLVEYSRNTDLISDVNVSFLDILTAIWNRIVINENATDIKNVLNDEITDAECKCFTGRVSRLVNCLSGVDSLVDVKIADNEQIGNVIAVIGERLKANGRYTVELHKETVSVELKELGYSEEVVSEWLIHIE